MIPQPCTVIQYGQKSFTTNSCKAMNHIAAPAAVRANANSSDQAIRRTAAENRGPSNTVASAAVR